MTIHFARASAGAMLTAQMTAQKVAEQLGRIATTGDDFLRRSRELVESWEQEDMGVESVEPILRFMEEHPSIDYGVPGHLVHFVERFCEKGYEPRLVESIWRKPTSHTVWMLNRLINGSRGAVRTRYVQVMKSARNHPLSEPDVVTRIDDFLRWIESRR